MRTKLQTLLLAALIAVSTSALADLTDDLMALVNGGKTLAEAVGELVQASPGQAGDIISAASSLVPSLSPSQCATDANGQPMADCSAGIGQAAIANGGDPAVVFGATAAGGSGANAATGAAGIAGGAGGAGSGGGGNASSS